MKIAGQITKAAAHDDGTLTIEGIASTEAVDSQGDVVTAAAMKGAFPEFMKGGTGSLREMHQASAVGVVTKASVGADGIARIIATVVDPTAVLKVKAGVYRGLSIGGRTLARLGKTITQINLVEISLVDRPANEDAVLTMVKAEYFGNYKPTVRELIKSVSFKEINKRILQNDHKLAGLLDRLSTLEKDILKLQR